MQSTNFHRIWFHAQTGEGIEHFKPELLNAEDTLVGSSDAAMEPISFPNGALVPALYAAMHGDIDLLLIEECALARLTQSQASELVQVFSDYGVTVKSCSSSGSNNS